MGSLRKVLFAVLLSGCFHHAHPTLEGAALGRVVIYRNGVAYYERHAVVEDGKLTVRVPRDRVDDFLKSLTVIDASTQKPLSVTIPRTEVADGGYLTMTVDTGDRTRAPVLMTYVTESPAWKPSYRAVIGPDNKIMLEGWAIVDNVSGEDWNRVQVGVGASSALAFRYDLWSVRRVDRDLLQGEDRFAIAPPTGVSPYAEGGEEVADLDGAEAGSSSDGAGIAFSGGAADKTAGSAAASGTVANGGTIAGQVTDKTAEPLAGVTVIATSPALAQTQTAITDEHGMYQINGLPSGDYLVTFYYGDATLERSGIHVALDKTVPVGMRIDTSRVAQGEVIKVEAKAPTIDPTSTSQGMTIDKSYIDNAPAPGRTFSASVGAAAGSQEDTYIVDGVNTTSLSSSGSTYEPPAPPPRGSQLEATVKKMAASRKDVVIEVHGTSEATARSRAGSVRDKLVDAGVPANRIHVTAKIGAGEADRVRLLAVAPGEVPAATAAATGPKRAPGGDEPVGESRFMAERPMTVKAGTSAMVAMVHGETTGGVVYLYDPISERGDDRFAFRAVRIDNPTDDTLEPGPVTVYGDGRFIGEGITEPVPPRASVVVPFALDKQVIVTREGADTDRIAKLETVQRGVITAEIQHRRVTTFTVASRSADPVRVFLRHKLADGWTLVDAPPKQLKVGDSDLFEVDLGPRETAHVEVAETTPIERTLDLAQDGALDLMKVYLDEPDASPALKKQIEDLMATHRKAADLIDKIATMRDELTDYRARGAELHAQLVTLKAVRTGGDLMASLRAKLVEISRAPAEAHDRHRRRAGAADAVARAVPERAGRAALDRCGGERALRRMYTGAQCSFRGCRSASTCSSASSARAASASCSPRATRRSIARSRSRSCIRATPRRRLAPPVPAGGARRGARRSPGRRHGLRVRPADRARAAARRRRVHRDGDARRIELADRARTAGRLAPAAAIEIGRQLASALDAAHAAGVVHRDLKPDNIFLAPDPAAHGGERVKVLDFGHREARAHASAMHTAAKLVFGTPRYMSPEQCAIVRQRRSRAATSTRSAASCSSSCAACRRSRARCSTLLARTS